MERQKTHPQATDSGEKGADRPKATLHLAHSHIKKTVMNDALNVKPPILLRWVGLFLFPALLIGAGLFSTLSRRRLILFLCSFSFQTSLLGWLFLLTKNPLLGFFSSRYLRFVMLVWAITLGNLEDNAAERSFNVLLHYGLPICVEWYWSSIPQRFAGNRYWQLGFCYPFAYFLLMLTVNRWIGYELYPILSTDPFKIMFIWAICDVYHWYDNNASNKHSNKDTEK